MKPARNRNGFTLAEALIASVFLAVSAVGLANALASASKQSQHLAQSTNCQELARELLEEVTSKSFTVRAGAGWSASVTNRATYDDAMDYNGYTDNSTAGIQTLRGTTVNFGDGGTYTRTVAFEYRATPTGASAASGDFGMVTVTVSAASGASVTLQRLLSNPVVRR